MCRTSDEFRNILEAPEAKWKRHTVLSSDSGYSTADSLDKCGLNQTEVGSGCFLSLCVAVVVVVAVVVFSCDVDLTSSTRILFVVVVTRWEHTAKRMLSACTCTFSDTVICSSPYLFFLAEGASGQTS